MFLRPMRVKSNVVVKATERKRLCRRVTTQFPELETSILDILLPSKCGLDTTRVTTDSGTIVSIISVNKEPLFFEYDDRLFPTVYTLWQACNLVKSIYTWQPVMEKMLGGADLMLPGVVGKERGGETIEGIVKGQICAIALVGNRSAVGVAISLMSSQEMLECRMRGKGFKVLHLYGDKLWEMGSHTNLPFIHPPIMPPSTSSTDTETLNATAKESSGLVPHGPKESLTQFYEDSQMHHQLQQTQEVDTSAKPLTACASVCEVQVSDYSESACLQSERETQAHKDTAESDTMVKELEYPEPTSAEQSTSMDELIEECFLQALKTSVRRTQLPILTSTFYSAHMLPLCPAHLRLDIKKSSYRKLSRFLHTMTEKDVIKVEERQKGVESIISVNQTHPLIQGFSPSLLECSDTSATAVVSEVRSTKPVMCVTELYIPSHKLLPIFSWCGHTKSSMLSASQVREVVTSYVRANELVSAQNSCLIVLDPILYEGLHQKNQVLCERLPWKELFDRVFKNMKPAYSVSTGVSPPVARKGQLLPVQMTVVQRAGNKKVTLVHNLELYGIPAEELAHTVQRRAAASTTVTTPPEVVQVLVQGNAVKTIAQVLQSEYGLPLKYIEAIDKVKPPKRKGGRKT